MSANNPLIYEERLSSKWTQALFLALTAIFSLLFIWRLVASGKPGLLAVVFFGLALMFLFYVLNYRVLTIRLTEDSVRLIFGVFTWRVPFENVATCRLDDDLPLLMKYGGAGIHFMLVRNRYRVSFNFLGGPRVVVGLKHKAGPVKDVSFSTYRPDELIPLIQARITASDPA